MTSKQAHTLTRQESEDRKRLIIQMRKPGPEQMSLQEVADQFGISRQRVHSIENHAHSESREKKRRSIHMRIYRFQKKFHEKHQRYATKQEVVDAGIASSPYMVGYYYQRMQAEGMIEIMPRISRGIKLLPLETAKEPDQALETMEAA
jgi:predicted DNA-binding protein YlxM (UPF0122 family)